MKIFLVPHPKNYNPIYTCPRGEHIVRQGLIENNVELVNSYEESDFAILDYVPHDGEKKWVYESVSQYEHKLVCVDWVDEPDRFIYEPSSCKAYFKRSFCLPEKDCNLGLVSPSRKEIDNPYVLPFAYCALLDFDIHSDIKYSDRPITIGCYLRPTCPNRAWTLVAVQQIAQQLGVSYHVGEVNSSSRSIGSKCHYDNEYLNYLANTKIIVTCQPSGWEGDSRLWEALMSGAVVITDRIYTKYLNKPINDKHLIEFEIGNIEDLFSRLQWLVKNDGQELADAGKKFTLEHHMPKARMKVVLDHLKGLQCH